MDGLLLVDKPSGWTSFDVVAKVRGVIKHAERQSSSAKASEGLQPRKRPRVGHTGTLDPLATGLLVLCLGSYCKRAQEFSKLDKVYEVTMKLGETSTTGDEEGEKTIVSSEKPPQEAILAALQAFTGEIMQTPPAYSAVKVNGQRAYKLARAGQEVVIQPRKVTVYKIIPGHNVKGSTSHITDWYEYPEVKFTAKASSGTYIRSLVEDIGKELGTGAYMTALCRTQIGDFSLQDAITEVNYTAISENILTK
jgi:tRNA pseudouridine55 synthase